MKNLPTRREAFKLVIGAAVGSAFPVGCAAAPILARGLGGSILYAATHIAWPFVVEYLPRQTANYLFSKIVLEPIYNVFYPSITQDKAKILAEKYQETFKGKLNTSMLQHTSKIIGEDNLMDHLEYGSRIWYKRREFDMPINNIDVVVRNESEYTVKGQFVIGIRDVKTKRIIKDFKSHGFRMNPNSELANPISVKYRDIGFDGFVELVLLNHSITTHGRKVELDYESSKILIVPAVAHMPDIRAWPRTLRRLR